MKTFHWLGQNHPKHKEFWGGDWQTHFPIFSGFEQGRSEDQRKPKNSIFWNFGPPKNWKKIEKLKFRLLEALRIDTRIMYTKCQLNWTIFEN